MLVSSWKAQRDLRQGHDAWCQGRLGRAISLLEPLAEKHPESWDARLPLARALAESGETAAALALLEPAGERVEADGAAWVYRGLILHDAGDGDGARQAFSRLGVANVLVSAMNRLLSGEDVSPLPQLPPGAIWLPDIAARILARLEDQLYRQDPARATALNHELFCPREEAPGGGEPAAPPPASAPASEPRGPQEWAGDLETLFESRDYERVLRQYELPAAPAAWKTADATTYYAFACIALSRSQEGVRLLAQLREEGARGVEVHFLEGLGWSRVHEPLRAGVCFARAARAADTEIHYVLAHTAQALETPVPA